MSATVVLFVIAKAASLIAMLVAAWVDVLRRIIPNETVVVIAVSGLLTRLLIPQEASVWFSIGVALAALVFLGQLSRLGLMGGGDAKLIAAATLTVPLDGVLPMLLYVAIAGGAVALFYLARDLMLGRQPALQAGKTVALAWLRRPSVPYAVSVLLGVLSLHVGQVLR